MHNFWQTANASFSEKDRDEYHRWRRDLYEQAEKLRDASHALPDDPRFSQVCKRVELMFQTVAELPFLQR